MSLLIDAGIDPGDIDFKWAADAPSAAKIFVSDPSYDAFVGWSPDIYNITDRDKSTRLVVTTGTANHLIADVWAVRNDFFHDNPEVVYGLVQGIFDGMDMVRKDPSRAASPGQGLQPPGGRLQEHDWQGRRHYGRRRAPDQLPREHEVLPGPVQPGELRGGVEQRLDHLQVAGHHRHHRAAGQGQGGQRARRVVRGIRGRARPIATDLQAQRPGQYERRGRRRTGPDQGGHGRLRAEQVRARPEV